MSTADRIDALNALADALGEVAKAEEKAAKAKEAYRDHPTAKSKAAHRAASQALAAARQKTRGDDTVRAVAPGDVSITPATVTAHAKDSGS